MKKEEEEKMKQGVDYFASCRQTGSHQTVTRPVATLGWSKLCVHMHRCMRMSDRGKECVWVCLRS